LVGTSRKAVKAPAMPQGRLAQATGIDLFGVETIGFSVEVLLSSAGIQLSKWVISPSKQVWETPKSSRCVAQSGLV
jgi:hypothetical protein